MSEPLYCNNHPNVPTYLRCNRCGAPICPKCAVRTEVGYRCPACVNQQQRIFYEGFRPAHYLIVVLVALPLSLIAGWIVPSLGWFVIFLGPLVGLGIGEVSHRAIGRRRGRYTWLLVSLCIVLGTLPRILLSLLPAAMTLPNPRSLTGVLWPLLWAIVYAVTAVGSAVARLRTGRRR